MTFYADLHIHSKYSRACSRDGDLEHLAWWAARKGVTVVGTGDFTHPAWSAELRELLVPAEPGLFRLRPDVQRRVTRTLPSSCRGTVRFLLSVEISTIYKRAERTRKVHHLLYAPSFDAASRITTALGKIGNLASDGRPILGLDSRDLLEVTLDSDPGSYLVPAHVWTPWFSVLGSKSGFDAVADCYADLAEHIFAVETGLSSDPPMNWRVGSLDRYRLVSNSDAHSPPALAREASVFATDVDYYAIRTALETGVGYVGSVEFFPEEGKYHLDGHRKCDVRLAPEATRELDGRCPTCGRPLTVGVLHRVGELADRLVGERPAGAADYRNSVPLPEIVGEIRGVGPKSKSVMGHVAELVAALGPELSILDDVPLDDVRRAGGAVLGEAIARLRRGEVTREAGYDGEYGTIRLFEPTELRRPARNTVALFDLPDPPETKRPRDVPDGDAPPRGRRASARHAEEGPAGDASRADPTHGRADSGSPLDGLDPDQRAAAAHRTGPLLIIAGPGTGKTRTLTHRFAHLVTERGVAPEHCLAVTFTRRAAGEMRERLTALVPRYAAAMTVTTFHGLGAMILREHTERVGPGTGFRIADEAERFEIAREMAGSDREARLLLAGFDGPRPTPARPPAGSGGAARDPGDAEARDSYEKRLRERGLVDFVDLLGLPVRLLRDDPDLAAHYRDRWRWIGVDEYQDVDPTQYALLRTLAGTDANITAIGDPDQAIYSFRGSDVGIFLAFGDDFPGATTIRLTRNYRCAPAIVTGAVHAIAPTSLVPDRALHPQRTGTEKIDVREAADPRAEGELVARTIDGLLGGASFHSLDSGRADGHHTEHLSLSDIAVLYRTDAQAEPVMEALSRAGLPYQKRSHDRLAARPGVREIAHELPYQPAGALDERIARAADALMPAHDEVALRSATALLAGLAARCGDDLEAFLDELAQGVEVDLYDPRADRIALLTLHAAKGLEFPVVFLVGCEEGLLPLRFPGARGVDDAEERRLFFVGMTRAGSRLHLSHARRRNRYGVEHETSASPFLRAIPAELVSRAEPARRRPRDRQLRLL